MTPAVTAGSQGTATTGTVSGSHSYAAAGDYTVTVWVTDDDGGGTADHFRVSVRDTPPPSLMLAHVVGDGVLMIHAGPLAAERGIGQVDGDETFTIEHVTGNAANETISVQFAGQSQTFAGIRQIIAHAGAGQDTIQLRPGVLCSAILSGGSGDDVLGGGDAGDMLSGGAGTNQLIGGLGDDTYTLGGARTTWSST